MVNMNFCFYCYFFLVSTQTSKYFTCCSFCVDFVFFILQILNENRHFSKIRAVFSDSYYSKSIPSVRSCAENIYDFIFIDTFIENTLSDTKFHDTFFILTCSRISFFPILFFHNQGMTEIHADE